LPDLDRRILQFGAHGTDLQFVSDDAPEDWERLLELLSCQKEAIEKSSWPGIERMYRMADKYNFQVRIRLRSVRVILRPQAPGSIQHAPAALPPCLRLWWHGRSKRLQVGRQS